MPGAGLEQQFKPCTVFMSDCIILGLEDYYVEIYY
jgi:hypothetical protein